MGEDVQPNATTPSAVPSEASDSSGTQDADQDENEQDENEQDENEQDENEQDEGGSGSDTPVDVDGGLTTSGSSDDVASENGTEPANADAAVSSPTGPSDDEQDDNEDDNQDEPGDSDEGPSPSCGPGTYLFEGPSGLQCRACEEGTFTVDSNSPECTAWRDCEAPSQYQLLAPTSERDRECGQCSASSVTSADNQTQCLELAFQMQDDRVAFESEHFDVADERNADASWREMGDESISNGRGVEIGPEAGEYWTSDPLNEAPHLDYRVRFTREGTFYLFIRGDAGADPQGSDSCFAGVDGALAPTYTFATTTGVWGWRGHALEVDSAGVHTVSIYAREDGFRVDKVVIQADDSAPSDAGPDESPRQ